MALRALFFGMAMFAVVAQDVSAWEYQAPEKEFLLDRRLTGSNLYPIALQDPTAREKFKRIIEWDLNRLAAEALVMESEGNLPSRLTVHGSIDEIFHSARPTLPVLAIPGSRVRSSGLFKAANEVLRPTGQSVHSKAAMARMISSPIA
jgi:hypothetical protein